MDERCDSCKGVLDPVADVNRWRHHDCPPPPLPAAALAVLDRVARMGGRGRAETKIDPPGRLNDDDVFVEGMGWVSAQFAAELPIIAAAQAAAVGTENRREVDDEVEA